MKTLKSALIAGLALAFSLSARAEISAQAWLESYYLNPQPAELGRAVQRLSHDGYFDQSGHVAISIGFLATVFAQNPQRVDGWLMEFNGLPLKHQKIIASALWQAGQPLGAEMLKNLGEFAANRDAVLRLANTPPVAIDDTPVLSTSSMNLHWGAFLATGDQRHILAVLDAIGTNRPGLDTAARVALAQEAAEHPRVMEICRAQLDRQPRDVQQILRAAVNEASAAHPRT